MKYRFLNLLNIPALVMMACVGVAAQAQPPMLLENPTVSRSQIAFSYAGDIWVVPREGGEAKPVMTTPAREGYPVFSPDGSEIAFARLNPATGPIGWDVFVAPASGGRERRVTYHPDADLPVNWTPDGKNVLVMSLRYTTGPVTRLYTIPAQGGFATEVPVPRGWRGSLAPAGDAIAYTPLPNPRETLLWRNYRGGSTSRIWLVKLSDASTEVIPRGNVNDTDPMWIGDKVYFVSDRDDTDNLFVYDTTRKSITQLTRFQKYGIKSASSNGEAIVFNRNGGIHLFNLQTNQVTSINVRVSGDFPEIKSRKIDPVQWTSGSSLAPDAKYLLLGIRGEIFTANTATGQVSNITRTPGAVEKNAAWSPDGKWIAYFSDESGEMELCLQPAPGGPVRRISIETKPSQYSELTWSPDSTRLVFSDSHLALWCFDLAQNAFRRIDTMKHTDGDFSFQPAWSPDSRWLAYSKFGFNRVRTITLYHFETGKITTVTTPHIDAQQPLFDQNEKFLYFLGSNRTGLVESQGMSGFPFRTQVTRSLYAVVLNANDSSPLLSDQKAGSTKASRVAIDLDKIGERILFMPFWPSQAGRIMAGKPGTLFIVEGAVLHKFVIGKTGLEKFVEGAGNYRLSSDGSRLALRRQGVWSIVSTDSPPKSEDGRLKLDPIELTIEPREEWKQMFAEAWRRMRESFYDPNLHGQNLTELQTHYAAYLPNVVTREDLNTLFKEMFSHLSVSHMLDSGGDIVVPQGEFNESVGLLGADFEISEGRYRIKRILVGDNSRRLASPLAQPGVNAKIGEYLLAVDSEEIKADASLYRYFLNKALKAVSLKIGPRADGKDARVVTVVPIGSDFELRHNDWAESNRRRVAELSAGKLAYIYLPNTGDAGYNAFNRDFYAQLDKQGVIIDGRFNQGGRSSDYIIDTLRRVPLQRAKLRDAEDIRIPTGIIEGPKVLLTNESAGSGGDLLPWMWQQTKLGPVVGTRTTGYGVGATTYQLLDGGSFQVPDWGWYDQRLGTWLVENRGVTPDYEIEIMPPEWRAGRDPQLEKAVQLAMDALKRIKPAPSKRPTYPVYK
ncbi:MAG: S41 family peptidase [Pyrinomonadaceae bacterium]